MRRISLFLREIGRSDWLHKFVTREGNFKAAGGKDTVARRNDGRGIRWMNLVYLRRKSECRLLVLRIHPEKMCVSTYKSYIFMNYLPNETTIREIMNLVFVMSEAKPCSQFRTAVQW